MYCNACGKVIADDAAFCTYCGVRVGAGVIHPPKRVMRSRSDRKIGGVCAGLAVYFGLDVILVRLIWVVLTIASGIVPGVVAYILSWVIIPEEPSYAVMVPPGSTVTTA